MLRQKSREMYESACKVTPGGINSEHRGLPYYEPHPIYIKKGIGSKIYDIDGNEYLDYVLGFGPCILGHAPEVLIGAIQEELKNGQLYVAENNVMVELAEMFVNAVPCADMVRFCSSGFEAVFYSIRLARGYSGREKIVRFEGSFHGHYDDVMISLWPPIDFVGLETMPNKIPQTPGLPSNTAENVIVQPYNNEAILEKTITERGHEIAAVIMEPIVTSGLIMPKKGYLDFVRKITKEHGILLIFDEIVTGFRVGLGGAQKYFHVEPDIATFAKALGAGFPISAIAGKREVMECLGEGKIQLGGTFNANRLSVVAAKTTLEELSRNGGAAYKHMYKIGDSLIRGLIDIGKDIGIPTLIQGLGPLFHIYFTQAEAIWNYREAQRKTDKRLYTAFIKRLLEEGIFHHTAARWVLSTAHSEEDIDKTLEAAHKALKAIHQ